MRIKIYEEHCAGLYQREQFHDFLESLGFESVVDYKGEDGAAIYHNEKTDITVVSDWYSKGWPKDTPDKRNAGAVAIFLLGKGRKLLKLEQLIEEEAMKRKA